MRFLFALLTLLIPCAYAAPDFSQGITNLGNPPTSNNWEEQNQNTEAAANAALQGASAKPQTGIYTLGGGDKIRMTVFGEEDLTGQYEVDGTGTLALPLIGNVNVMGKSLRDAEDAITKRYSSGYLINPRVSLEVLNFRPFFILGEVNKPGSYPYVNDLTVINAVALAGGYTPRASTGTVYIRRAADPKHAETKASEADKVYPGDAIRVDERFF